MKLYKMIKDKEENIILQPILQSALLLEKYSVSRVLIVL